MDLLTEVGVGLGVGGLGSTGAYQFIITKFKEKLKLVIEAYKKESDAIVVQQDKRIEDAKQYYQDIIKQQDKRIDEVIKQQDKRIDDLKFRSTEKLEEFSAISDKKFEHLEKTLDQFRLFQETSNKEQQANNKEMFKILSALTTNIEVLNSKIK